MNISDAYNIIQRLQAQLATVISGQTELLRDILVGLFADGHVLIEGMPGLGKTLCVKTLAKCIRAQFSRIQFTPDLLPSDIVGYQKLNLASQELETCMGPIRANIVLADELNRASAKVQSALLEAMAERQVTIAGASFLLPSPFLVFATQNSMDTPGTYPLSEAQLDRFMLLTLMRYPQREDEKAILRGESGEGIFVTPSVSIAEILDIRKIVSNIYVDDAVINYILDIIEATRTSAAFVHGASPRGSLALLNGSRALALIRQRAYVLPQDIQDLAPGVLGHRVLCEDLECSPQAAIRKLVTEIQPP